jgi:hypothetical protein
MMYAVGARLTVAEIVFDTFHVLQHASAALDEGQEFFRSERLSRDR